MRSFNTSGPNIPSQHYTLSRPGLVEQGMGLVRRDRYYTIWAPRQTGKSTFFRLMAERLEQEGYRVIHFNVENYKDASFRSLMEKLGLELGKVGLKTPAFASFDEVSNYIGNINDRRLVLIIDEIEGLNPDLFGQFLHTVRNLYHSRESHCLKSVILVGVTNIVGVVQDHASPFNIADNLLVPYFTQAEVDELLAQHSAETGQRFERRVAEKVFEVTAGQPGLVNGFAFQLVERSPQKPLIGYADYLRVEDWYLTEAIDKNVANILNKAEAYRPLLERMLFTEIEIPFLINRPEVKALHTNGIIRKGESGQAEFWVPLYKKALFDAFYPYINGEKEHVSETLDTFTFFDAEGALDVPKLLGHYKAYAARRGFRPFIEKRPDGSSTLKESGLVYSFETFLAAFVIEAEGKSYREADAGLGKSDLILYLRGREYLFETKKYYSPGKFTKGKRQLAHYARSLGLDRAAYIVFTPRHIDYPPYVAEGAEEHDGTRIDVYLVPYDEEKDF
jgi:hypothetical protein